MFLDFNSSIKQNILAYDAASQAAAAERADKIKEQNAAPENKGVPAEKDTALPDPNTLRALDAAGMPPTAKNVALVEQMMQEGMRIDKNNLQNMYRLLLKNPEVDSAQLVKMQQMGLEVNDVNIRQFESYENHSHQIMDGLGTIGDELLKESLSLFESRQGHGVSDAMQLLKDVVQIAQMPESAVEVLKEAQAWLDTQGEMQNLIRQIQTEQETKGAENGVAKAAFVTEDKAQQMMSLLDDLLSVNDRKQEEASLKLLLHAEEGRVLAKGFSEGSGALPEMADGETAVPVRGMSQEEQGILQTGKEEQTQEEKSAAGESAGGTGPEKPQIDIRADFVTQNQQLIAQLREAAAKLNECNPRSMAYRLAESDFLEKATQLEKAVSESVKHSLFGSKGLMEQAKNQLVDQMMLRPEDVADGKKVEQLYQKLLVRMNHLEQALAGAGLENTQVSQNIMQMQDNVQFMNQLNQVWQYVQLPLRMFEQHTNGDLYVYTNKKHLADPDGNISALLHLNMDHIGPVDVHVQLGSSNKVQTHFYLESDELIDFISEHLHLLDEKLTAKGYQVSTSATLQNDRQEKTVMEHMMDHQAASVRNKLMSVSSFDAKA